MSATPEIDGKVYYPEIGIYDYPATPVDYSAFGNAILSNVSVGAAQGLTHTMPWVGRLSVEAVAIRAAPKALAQLDMDMASYDFRHRPHNTMQQTNWFDESHPKVPYQHTSKVGKYIYHGTRVVGAGLQAGAAAVMIYNINNASDPITQTGIEIGRLAGGYASARVGASVAGAYADTFYEPLRHGYKKYRLMPPILRIGASVGLGVYGAMKAADMIEEVGVVGLPRRGCEALYNFGQGLGNLAEHPESITLPAAPLLIQRGLNYSRFGQWSSPKQFLTRVSFKPDNPPLFQTMKEVKQAVSNRDQFKWVIDTQGRFSIAPVKNKFGKHIHHTDLAGARPVIGAGEFRRKGGFTRHSGHYQPDKVSLSIRQRCIERASQHPAVRALGSAARIGGTMLVFADAARVVGMTSEENPHFSPTAGAMLAAGAYYPPALLVPVVADAAISVGEFYESAGVEYEAHVKEMKPTPVAFFDGITEMERAQAAQMMGRSFKKAGQGVVDVLHWVKEKGDPLLGRLAKACQNMPANLDPTTSDVDAKDIGFAEPAVKAPDPAISQLTQQLMDPRFQDPYSAGVMGSVSSLAALPSSSFAEKPSFPAGRVHFPTAASSFAMKALSLPSTTELVFAEVPTFDTRSDFGRRLDEARCAPPLWEQTLNDMRPTGPVADYADRVLNGPVYTGPSLF